MVTFALLACLLFGTVFFTLLKIWKIDENKVIPTSDSEWNVLVRKRNEIESDLLLPPQVQVTLREEWSGMASSVLARARDTLPACEIPARRNGRWWIAGTSCLLALTLYGLVGQWDAQALQTGTQRAMLSSDSVASLPMADGARHPGGKMTIQERIGALQEKLKSNPKDLEGWVLLSRSLGIKRDFSGAVAALEKALALSPGHPDILADLADVLAMTQDKKLAGRPLQFVQQALKSAPDHRKALSLAATAAMQEDNPVHAATYWRRLRATFPPGAADIAEIDTILATLGPVGEKAPVAVQPIEPASAMTAAVTAPSGTSISGSVTLSADLSKSLKQHPLPASAMLFVFAKTRSGPPMPVAAARFPVQQFTLGKAIGFTLDDTQSMSPASKLSDSAQANVEARISMTGVAGKQPGDWYVAVSDVKLGSTGLQLVVRSVYP